MTIDLYERLGRFVDLIYCPLDVPSPPPVAREALVEWVRDARAGRSTNEEQLSLSNTQAGYPWNSAYASYHGEWLHGFEKRFPDIPAYLERFPARKWVCVNVLIQEPQQDVWLHTDPDPVLGWRVYLGRGGARLFFCPAIERSKTRLSTWTDAGMRDWSKHVKVNERIYASSPAEAHAWALTSLRAAHGVETHAGRMGDRTTLLLVPEASAIDVDAYLELLERSVRRYSDYAIWYSGPSA